MQAKTRAELSTLETQVDCFCDYVDRGTWRARRRSATARLDLERLLSLALCVHTEFARLDEATSAELVPSSDRPAEEAGRAALVALVERWVASSRSVLRTLDDFVSAGFPVEAEQAFRAAVQDAAWMTGEVAPDEDRLVALRDRTLAEHHDCQAIQPMLRRLPPGVRDLAHRACVLFHRNPHAALLDNRPLPDAGRGQHPAGSRSIAITARVRAFYAPAEAAALSARAPAPVWYWVGTGADFYRLPRE